MRNLKALAGAVALVALVAPICFHWTEAQKSASSSSSSYQQQIAGLGSGTNSAYGGYQSQRPSRGRESYSGSRTETTFVQRPVYQQQQQQQTQVQSTSYQQQQDDQAEAAAEPASYGSVNGQPGVDFPAYTRVPKTSFSCDGLPYDYGMYADEETGCQAYHVCYNGRKDSFLCGVGTVFNQRILHCDYWYSVDCGKSSQYWSSNAYMGSSQPEPGPAQASGSSYQQSSYSSKRTESNLRPAQLPQRSQVNYQASASSRETQQVQQDGY